MNKIPKEKIQKIIHIGIVIIASFVVGLSLQLVHAWTEPTLTAPNGNLGAPINTGASTQTKSEVIYINGGVIAPIIWDTDNTAYYLNPFGTSQISSLYANGGFFTQGNAGLSFSDHNGGFNMIDNTWIRATGVGNIYAPGEMQATNIRANGTLCIGSDCRNSWAAGGLQLDTWQGNHYSGSNGAEYATIFYDTNNTSFYLDPSSTSNLNTINASTGSFAYITSVFGIKTPTILTAATFSDANNSSYYVTPSGTSNMNTIYANNIHFVNAYNDSHRRLKENITPLSDSLDKINQINGLSFYWKDKAMGENRNIGVIAQDVEKVYPELVSTNPKTGLKSVEYGNLVAPLIEAIKELTHKIDDLFSKYFDQQKQIDELRLEINALKNSR